MTSMPNADQFNILLVDDDTGFLSSVSGALQEGGYTVFKARDGLRASEIVREKSIGLAFVAVEMPIIDGIEVLHDIRWHTPKTPVVLMSDSPTREEAIAAFEAGAVGYLGKPLEGHYMLVKVQELRHAVEVFPPDSESIGHDWAGFALTQTGPMSYTVAGVGRPEGCE